MDIEEPVVTLSVNPAAPATTRPTPVTPIALQVGSSSQPAVVVHPSSTWGKTGPGCHPDFTDADKLKARALEPAFESMQRQADVCEDVIMATRLQEIHSRQLFAALDRSEEGFCETCKEAFHIDPSLGFKHKRELGRLLPVWNTAKVQRDTKVQIEAVHKAHGEPISMIVADRTSLIRTFKVKYGNNIHPSCLLAQSYFGGFEERLTDGTMIAEPLSHVLSLAEEKQQKEKPSRSRLAAARTKYKIMTNLWLLAQMRGPGRRLYADLWISRTS